MLGMGIILIEYLEKRDLLDKSSNNSTLLKETRTHLDAMVFLQILILVPFEPFRLAILLRYWRSSPAQDVLILI
jgi:hypothetical protein